MGYDYSYLKLVDDPTSKTKNQYLNYAYTTQRALQKQYEFWSLEKCKTEIRQY